MKAKVSPVRAFAPGVVLFFLFLWSVFRFDDIAFLLAPLAPGKRLFVERTSLAVLAGQHLVLSLGTTIASFALAFPLGVLAASSRSGAWSRLADRAGSFGETFPTVALMALLVPVVGYGASPVWLALTLYGVLPILRGTVTGLHGVPPGTIDSARGMGMTPSQLLRLVRLPLAMPHVLQGLRIGLVVNISAATVGAAVGAGGFGVPIVSGIRSFDTLLILKGSIPVALLALSADSLVRGGEKMMKVESARVRDTTTSFAYETAPHGSDASAT